MMAPPGDILHYKKHAVWDSRQLWSLADMINFYLSDFMNARNALWQEVCCALRYKEENPNGFIPESLRPRIDRNIRNAIRDCVAALQIEQMSPLSIELEQFFDLYMVRPRPWEHLASLLSQFWKDLEREICGEVFIIIRGH